MCTAHTNTTVTALLVDAGTVELALATEEAVGALALVLPRRHQVAVAVVLADATKRARILVLALAAVEADVAVAVCTRVGPQRALAVLVTVTRVAYAARYALFTRLALEAFCA